MTVISDVAYGVVPILFDAGEPRYLLIQHNKGHWAFPKGHKDEGETDLQAACREFQEEVGISTYRVLEDVTFREHYSFSLNKDTQIDKTVTYYLALVPPPAPDVLPTVTIQPEELADFRWCSFEGAKQLVTFDAARQVLQECHAALPALTENLTFNA
jgi:8-oxo-dGTP pyrophosphatase MutT (NUDIX family)